MELSPRTLNCLKRAHITKVGEILELADDDLLKIRNFGEKSLVELREKLAERGIGPSSDGSTGLDTGSSDGIGTVVAETAEPIGGLSAQDIRDLLGAGDVMETVAGDLPGNADGWGLDDDSQEGDDGEDED